MASREAAGLDNQKIPGNGSQTGFTTGATRSTDANKVDYEGHINPEVLAIYGDYMNRHRVQRDGQLRQSDNWQKGIPLYRYVKSLIRHTFEFWRMWRGTTVLNPDNNKLFTFQDVLCAILFNVMGIMYEMQRAKAQNLLREVALMPSEREEKERGDALKTEVSKKAYSDPLSAHVSPRGLTPDDRYQS